MRTPWFIGLCAVCLGASAMLLGSCSAAGSDQNLQGSGGTNGADSGSGGALLGGSGGGQGGSSFLDAASGGGAGYDEDATCAGLTQTAANRVLPVDIIFALDNSGSMDEEAVFVQNNMNVFSTGLQIAPPGIDPHVIVISADSTDDNGVCITPPLGSGSCPNDENPPGYTHIHHMVASSDSLRLLVSLFDDYKSALRQNSIKHVVVVSDDNSDLSAADFDQQFRDELQAFGAPPQYTFHSIFGFTEPNPLVCFNNPAADPCCAPLPVGSYTAEVGEVYFQLVLQTGGVAGNLCIQDFYPVFVEVTQAVVSSTTLACEWEIPTPSNGEDVDPNMVNVEASVAGSAPQLLGYVDSAQDCASVQNGWYFDDPVAPTKVFACPDTCAWLQSSGDAEISLQFGCKRQPAIPR